MSGITTAEWGFLSQPVHTEIPAKAAAVIGSAPWRDNAYLAFWDTTQELFGVTHVSTSPNAEGRRARFSVIVRGQSTELIETLEPGKFASESIDFDLESSTIRVSAPRVSATIKVFPRFVPADYSSTGLIPDLVKEVSLHHHQQGAEVHGEVTIGGVTTTVDGHGFRDRTWGPRDESVAWNEYAAIAGSLPDFELTLMKFRTADGTTTTHGFLLYADRSVPVVGLDLNRDASGLIDGAKVTTDEGRELTLQIRSARGGFWVPMGAGGPPPTMSAYDDAVDITIVGGAESATGAGFTEQGVIRYT